MGGHALPRASQKRGYTIRVHSCPFVSIRVHSCPFVSIRVHSCPFVSIRVHSCPFVSIRVHSCPFVSIRVIRGYLRGLPAFGEVSPSSGGRSCLHHIHVCRHCNGIRWLTFAR